MSALRSACETGGVADDDFLEVHVDETGDRGFGPRASPVFCLAACAFRHSKAHLVTKAMRDLNESLGRANVPMHAREHLRKHGRKMEACERLGALNGTVRLLYVVLPKNLVNSDSYLRDPIGAYNYPVKFLLERVSWLARDVRCPARVTLAAVRGLPPAKIRDYVNLLYRNPSLSSIEWPWLKPPLSFSPAQQRVGLQWADISAMALHQAVVPKTHPPHRVEPAYINALAPAVWGKRDLESYAVKSMVEGWHQSQTWWPAFTARVPVQ